MRTYRLTERVAVTREYTIRAQSEDDALDKMNSGEYEPIETEEENMGGIEVEIVKRDNRKRS